MKKEINSIAEQLNRLGQKQTGTNPKEKTVAKALKYYVDNFGGGAPSTAVWGNITGDIGNQRDLIDTVDDMIADELANFEHIAYKVADSVPTPTEVVIGGVTEPTQEGVRYLVKHPTENVYEEYILIDGVIYDIGSTEEMDLANYLQKTDVIDSLTSTETEKPLSAKQGKELKKLVSKKVYYFNNVANMKEDIDLKAGDTCQTLGYYNLNDKGEALYKIRSITDDDVIDNMILIPLNNNQLVAELIINDEINIKQLGAKNDNTIDCTQIITKALSICNIVKIPDGTYKITDEIIINESQSLIGEKENTILQFYGNNNCLVVNGRYITIKNIKINADDSVVSNNKIGIVINPNSVTVPSRSTFTNIIIESCVLRKFNKGISLNIMWQVTIRNCIIVGTGKGSDDERTNYGISYENNTPTQNWSGSGNIIESCYISNCSYGINILGGWNVTSVDTIIEGVWCSLYVQNTFRAVFINNWFEKNDVQPVLNSPIIIMGGRLGKLIDGITDEFPNDLNNLHLIWNDGDTHNRYNQKLFSDIANEEALLTGVKNQIPTATPTKITSLKAFSSRGNAITSAGNLSDNNLTGQLSIVGYGTAGGTSGKTYTQLEYSSGQTDGNNVDIAIRPVFEVDKNGGISNPASDGIVDIGKKTNKYRYGYFKNVIVLGDNGNLYKIGVDSSGNVKATAIS